MAITIPIEVQTLPFYSINIEELKSKVTDYVNTLVPTISKKIASDTATPVYHTSEFVDSLSLTGGQTVPANLKMEDIYE